MELTDQEMKAFDIIATLNYLEDCNGKEYISNKQMDEIIFRFGSKSHALISYYLEHLVEYFKNTSRYLESLKGK